MPTNLPQTYYKVEARYRAAQSGEEKLAYLEEMFSLVPKHKGTDHLRADLRRRMSELRETKDTQKGPSRQESLYHIDKEGAGTIAVIGPPNVGKSALVSALTNAEPEVAAYPFTTWEPTPGMMPIQDIQVQLIDTPPLSEKHVEPELISLIQRSDLILLVLDLQAFPIEQLEKSLAFLAEQHIAPRHRREKYDTEQYLAFIPFLIIANKADDAALDEDFVVLGELLPEKWPMLPLSVTENRHIEQFKEEVFRALEIIRVYSKAPGQDPDLDQPFVLAQGSTVNKFAGKVHRDFRENLRSARIWGEGVYDGQMVGHDHALHDGDVVELHM